MTNMMKSSFRWSLHFCYAEHRIPNRWNTYARKPFARTSSPFPCQYNCENKDRRYDEMKKGYVNIINKWTY